MTRTSLHPSVQPNDTNFSTPLPTPAKGQLARMETHRVKLSVTIVSVVGDIDQTNALTFSDYSLGQLVSCHGLILDLTGVEFFGAAGFSELHRISVSCARAGITWALIPGTAVSLILRVCDPDGLLPAIDTVSAALTSFPGSAPNVDQHRKYTSKMR